MAGDFVLQEFWKWYNRGVVILSEAKDLVETVTTVTRSFGLPQDDNVLSIFDLKDP